MKTVLCTCLAFFRPQPHSLGGPHHPCLLPGATNTGAACLWTPFLPPGWERTRMRVPEVAQLTRASVPLLHPDVAVVLGHPRLRVQEGEAHAALCTQPRVVAPAVLDGFLVELVPEPATR